MTAAQKIAITYLRIKFQVLMVISRKKAAREAVRLFCTPRRGRNSELPDLFVAAEKLHFILQGATIQGFRWNYPSRHRVLILHGFNSSVINFEHYIYPLLEKGYEVLAFDAPAHGQSGGTTITAMVYRDMIIHIHDHYGPVDSYMAHSMGGLALALAMEKIKHDYTCRLALIAPATESTTAVDHFFTFLRIKEKAVRRLFCDLIQDVTGHPLSWFSIARAMPQINAGILWLHDDTDLVTPLSDTIKIEEQNYPGVKFVITHGLGHRRIYRDKKVVDLVVNFL